MGSSRQGGESAGLRVVISARDSSYISSRSRRGTGHSDLSFRRPVWVGALRLVACVERFARRKLPPDSQVRDLPGTPFPMLNHASTSFAEAGRVSAACGEESPVWGLGKA